MPSDYKPFSFSKKPKQPNHVHKKYDKGTIIDPPDPGRPMTQKEMRQYHDAWPHEHDFLSESSNFIKGLFRFLSGTARSLQPEKGPTPEASTGRRSSLPSKQKNLAENMNLNEPFARKGKRKQRFVLNGQSGSSEFQKRRIVLNGLR